MYQNKKMLYYALLFLLGIGTVAVSVFLNEPGYWGGIGGGMAGVGGMRLFQGIRYRKNQDYAREVDNGTRDERNLFLYDKARSWTFGITVPALALASIVLRFAQFYDYSNVCVIILCAMLVIYCVSHWILRKKY